MRGWRSLTMLAVLILLAASSRGNGRYGWRQRLREHGTILLTVEHLYWIYLRRTNVASGPQAVLPH